MSAANGHVAVTVCAGCHLTECPGDCDWNDTGTKDTVCRGCCWDHTDNARSQHCLDHHDHGASHCPCTSPTGAGLIGEMRRYADFLDRLNDLYKHGKRFAWSAEELRYEAEYLERAQPVSPDRTRTLTPGRRHTEHDGAAHRGQRCGCRRFEEAL